LWRYGAGAALSLVAVAVRTLLNPFWGPQFAYIFAFPATLFAALLGGLGPGLLAWALGAVLTTIYVLPLDTGQTRLGFAVYLVISGLIVWIASALRRALLMIEQQAAALREQTRQASESAEQARLATRRLNALVHAAPVGISFSEDAGCERITGNPALLAQFEAGPGDNVSASAADAGAKGRQMRFFRNGREISAADLPLQRAVAENAVVPPMELEVELPSGRRSFLEGRAAPVRDDRGEIVGGIAITVDISERKRNEERIQVLMGEINHRSKNLLAVVQSIARQTMKGTEPRLFLEVFEKRIAGLAASQDLLVDSTWVGVDLADLVRSQLSHYKPLFGRRIVFEGPDCAINPAAAQALGMALHELGANAAKYGALSTDEGSVRVAWSRDEAAADPRFRLRWSESGGPAPAPAPRKGFGHTVLVRMVGHALDAQVTLDYPPSGLIWELTALADRVFRKDGNFTGV
jgi:two-component sensor histidine kinase